LHQVLPRRFEADVAGRVEIASRRTPLFELPSFGGVEVVRGFRRDDALGRRLWSLQNELWVPLPIGDESSKRLKAMLRENVKIAPFVDFGGVYKVVAATPGARSGLGVGLRFIYNPIIFKFDYAYGLGTAATGGSRGKFYLSIGSNLPF
jgi:hemolysin activation/secretion protein